MLDAKICIDMSERKNRIRNYKGNVKRMKRIKSLVPEKKVAINIVHMSMNNKRLTTVRLTAKNINGN